MTDTYYNFYSQTAHGWWGRRTFLNQWWRLQADDPYWVPPAYGTLRQALGPNAGPHLARLGPVAAHTEALRRRKAPLTALSGPLFEETVAAAVGLRDPRRRDRAAYLSLLHCANDEESLERLLAHLAEPLLAAGCRTIIGPTGLSPHLGSGLLQDYWSELPPLHTPSQPPYLPEVVGQVLHPFSRSRLYHLAVPSSQPPAPTQPATLTAFAPARLAADLLSLFIAACPHQADFPPPDAAEAAFILQWVGRWPLLGWLAQIEGEPAGFVLLQPDLAPHVRRATGGRNLLWRAWLAWAARRPVAQGRLLYGAVLPAWRGQGVGRQLLHQALATARQQGWGSLSLGPFPEGAPASQFLQSYGAEARQSYQLYQGEL